MEATTSTVETSWDDPTASEHAAESSTWAAVGDHHGHASDQEVKLDTNDDDDDDDDDLFLNAGLTIRRIDPAVKAAQEAAFRRLSVASQIERLRDPTPLLPVLPPIEPVQKAPPPPEPPAPPPTKEELKQANRRKREANKELRNEIAKMVHYNAPENGNDESLPWNEERGKSIASLVLEY
jgi:hypothetical protein